MAEIITPISIADTKRNIDDIDKTLNTKQIIKPLWGDEFKSLPLAVEEGEQKIEAVKIKLQTDANNLVAQGFYAGYKTEALLLSDTPNVAEMRARADDTRKIWRWTRTSAEDMTPVTGDWTDTGLSDKDLAIEYADNQKVQKYTALNRQGVLYEVTDAQGSPTWIQVSDTDGMPTEFSKSAIRGSAGISDSKLIILKDGALLFCVPDSNGNPTAISVRQSDGMFPDFVIENIASRLNITPSEDLELSGLQYKPKPTDFQILSSVARGVARHVVNAPLPSPITDYINSTAQPVRLTFPNIYSDATPLILVICFEGIGDFEDLTMRAAYADLKNHGVVWARCRFHENHYGNPQSMQDAREVYQKACEIAPIGGVVVVGNSMGGVAALNALTTQSVPNILGVYLTDPVCDLRQRYDNGRSGDINAAYDCTAATYLEKTKGHDPMLQHWSKFKGVPISIVATSNDSLVTMSAHTNKLAEKLRQHNDIKVIDTQAGWHNHPDEFIASNLTSFINQCATGAVITNI